MGTAPMRLVTSMSTLTALLLCGCHGDVADRTQNSEGGTTVYIPPPMGVPTVDAAPPPPVPTVDATVVVDAAPSPPMCEASTLCGNSCVDLSRDPDNCGACDAHCTGTDNGCVSGTCVNPGGW
jgi:hypothetical protein